MSMNRFLLHALIAFLALLSACATVPKHSADFSQVSGDMTTLSVYPASFALQQVGVFTSDMVSEMNHDIELLIEEAAEATIANSTCDLRSLEISDSSLAGDLELRDALFEQDAAITMAYQDIAASGKTMSVRYSGNIDYFADLSGSDYLVFLRGSGYFMTDWKKAINGALSGDYSQTSAQGITLDAFIVDANRGSVVWYNQVTATSDPRKRSQVLATVKKLFTPLLGDTKVKWDKDRDDELIDKYKEKMKLLEGDTHSSAGSEGDDHN